jgi:hypothetical protein
VVDVVFGLLVAKREPLGRPSAAHGSGRCLRPPRHRAAIGNSNATLYELYITPDSVLELVRNLVANRLATDGRTWAAAFGNLNSGTYNNEVGARMRGEVRVPRGRGRYAVRGDGCRGESAFGPSNAARASGEAFERPRLRPLNHGRAHRGPDYYAAALYRALAL